MPIKLTSVLEKVQTIPNLKNRKVLKEFNDYMLESGASESHQRNELLTLYYYALHLGETLLLGINKRQQVTAFLSPGFFLAQLYGEVAPSEFRHKIKRAIGSTGNLSEKKYNSTFCQSM